MSQVVEPGCTIRRADVQMLFPTCNLRQKHQQVNPNREYVTYVFHMNDKQPLLVHGIEGFSDRVYRHRDRSHRREEDNCTDESTAGVSMYEGDSERNSVRARYANYRCDDMLCRGFIAHSTRLPKRKLVNYRILGNSSHSYQRNKHFQNDIGQLCSYGQGDELAERIAP